MCPKCKSRERRKLNPYDFPPSWGYLNSFVFIRGLYIKLYPFEVFYCSNCGYEIGRWG